MTESARSGAGSFSPPKGKEPARTVQSAGNTGVGGFDLVFDPVYMVFDALHGVYMVERRVAQLDPRLAGEKNSPPCRPIYLLVEYFTWS